MAGIAETAWRIHGPRASQLGLAFHRAIAEYDYQGSYRGVYPIKVNQQRHIVEDLVRFSQPHHLGLEAGSKPELLVVLALLDDPEALIVCNGYKDRDYIETAMLAHKLGRRVIVVVEMMEELNLILELAKQHGVHPIIGVRAKLSSRGSGRWQSSRGCPSTSSFWGRVPTVDSTTSASEPKSSRARKSIAIAPWW